jgi:hypothetical protein
MNDAPRAPHNQNITFASPAAARSCAPSVPHCHCCIMHRLTPRLPTDLCKDERKNELRQIFGRDTKVLQLRNVKLCGIFFGTSHFTCFVCNMSWFPQKVPGINNICHLLSCYFLELLQIFVKFYTSVLSTLIILITSMPLNINYLSVINWFDAPCIACT